MSVWNSRTLKYWKCEMSRIVKELRFYFTSKRISRLATVFMDNVGRHQPLGLDPKYVLFTTQQTSWNLCWSQFLLVSMSHEGDAGWPQWILAHSEFESCPKRPELREPKCFKMDYKQMYCTLEGNIIFSVLDSKQIYPRLQKETASSKHPS